MARPCDGTSTDCNIIGVPGVEAKFGLGAGAKLPRRCCYKMRKEDERGCADVRASATWKGAIYGDCLQ